MNAVAPTATTVVTTLQTSMGKPSGIFQYRKLAMQVLWRKRKKLMVGLFSSNLVIYS